MINFLIFHPAIIFSHQQTSALGGKHPAFCFEQEALTLVQSAAQTPQHLSESQVHTVQRAAQLSRREAVKGLGALANAAKAQAAQALDIAFAQWLRQPVNSGINFALAAAKNALNLAITGVKEQIGGNSAVVLISHEGGLPFLHKLATAMTEWRMVESQVPKEYQPLAHADLKVFLSLFGEMVNDLLKERKGIDVEEVHWVRKAANLLGAAVRQPEHFQEIHAFEYFLYAFQKAGMPLEGKTEWQELQTARTAGGQNFEIWSYLDERKRTLLLQMVLDEVQASYRFSVDVLQIPKDQFPHTAETIEDIANELARRYHEIPSLRKMIRGDAISELLEYDRQVISWKRQGFYLGLVSKTAKEARKNGIPVPRMTDPLFFGPNTLPAWLENPLNFKERLIDYWRKQFLKGPSLSRLDESSSVTVSRDSHEANAFINFLVSFIQHVVVIYWNELRTPFMRIEDTGVLGSPNGLIALTLPIQEGLSQFISEVPLARSFRSIRIYIPTGSNPQTIRNLLVAA